MNDETTIDDGGPAFPVQGFTANASGSLDGTYIREPGLSMRDYFAGQAITGAAFDLSIALAAENNGEVDIDRTAGVTVGLVRIAYLLADAMLTARKQP